jgi:predicted RNA-binding protein YlxR (DUF448 family)
MHLSKTFFRCINVFIIFSPIFISSTSRAENFPEYYVNKYIQACSYNRGNYVKQVCSCTIYKAQKEFTFSQFQAFNTQIESTKIIPQEIKSIIAHCQKDPDSI